MTLVAVLVALAAANPAPRLVRLDRFSLKEQPSQIRALFEEAPHTITTAGESILRFHGTGHSQGCDDSSQWVFYFSRRENRLVSITRNLEEPIALETLIPRSAKPVLYMTPRKYPVLRAAMPDGREFIAPGARTLKDRVSQLQFIRSSDLARFYVDLKPAE